jgi:hypothetical protein
MSEVLKGVLSGAAEHVVIIDENNNQIIGRGANFSWQDTFEQVPVDEYGKTGIDEYSPGRMIGGGTLGTFTIPNLNDELPTRDTFATKSFTVQEIIAPGRPGAGTVLNVFQGVKFTVVGGNFGPTGVSARNVNFVYTNRINGEVWAEQQGKDYPAS